MIRIAKPNFSDLKNTHFSTSSFLTKKSGTAGGGGVSSHDWLER
jgi:hypothetical protein